LLLDGGFIQKEDRGLRRYETVFILRPDLGETQTKETIKRFEGIVGAGGGELIETDQWGSRELAYRIGNERRGYYVRLDYTAPSAVVSEVERNLKLAEGVLRYLSVMVEPEADAPKIRAEVEARKRRAEEARAAAESRAAAGLGAQTTSEAEETETEGTETVPEAEPDGGTQQG
jgi:small subunit ribosomal protein S6